MPTITTQAETRLALDPGVPMAQAMAPTSLFCQAEPVSFSSQMGSNGKSRLLTRKSDQPLPVELKATEDA
jgi:hypothetical protein